MRDYESYKDTTALLHTLDYSAMLLETTTFFRNIVDVSAEEELVSAPEKTAPPTLEIGCRLHTHTFAYNLLSQIFRDLQYLTKRVFTLK